MVSTVERMETSPFGEKRVTIHHLNWQAYQQILTALPETRATRLTYDHRTLEIYTRLEDHAFNSIITASFCADKLPLNAHSL